MNKLLLTIGALLFASIASQSARADSFFLTGSNDHPACNSTTPCAEVTLTGGGSAVTFTVSSLFSGYVFDTFDFNGPTGLTLGSTSGEVSSPSLNLATGSADGWGKFVYEFDTGKNGGSSGGDCVVTGGVPGAGCTFSFTVDGTGLTLSQFEVPSSGGTGTTDFAGHEASSANSGFAGNSVPVTTPEPSSLMLLGTGLLGAGGLFYRRMLQGK